MVFVFLNFIFSFMYFRFLSPSVIHDPPQVLPAPESLHHFLHVGQATLQVLCSPFLSPDLPHVLFSCTANQVLFWSLYTTTPIVASRQCAPPLAHCLPPATPPGLALPISPRPGRCWFLLNSFSLYVSN